MHHTQVHHSRKERPSLLCSLFTHLTLCIAVTLMFIYVLYWPNPVDPKNEAAGSYKFNWHPIMMVTAFCFFMGEALIAYRLLPFEHATQKSIHFILHTLALIAASIGLAWIIQFHNVSHIAHFYNIHSIVGLSAYVIFCVQYLMGTFTMMFPKLPEGQRAALLPLHKYFGIVLFFLTWLAMLTGLMDRERIQFKLPSDNFTPTYRMANAAGALIVLSGAVILYHFSSAAKQNQPVDGTHTRLLP